jgi:hypothetical protein
MFDCAKEVMGYHNDEVTLPLAERTEMRERRDTNRKRLKAGLEKQKMPKPSEFCSQGSYAMKTMVQDSERDYDLDDGVYFKREDLDGARGGEMSALEARQMVRDAIDDGSFKKKPEVRQNCVRVHYDAGYHVDLPVYRLVTIAQQPTAYYELASTEWKRSDARHVTEWFERENDRLSPDEENGKQVRRMCRLIKKFARSRASWKGQTASGFVITKLVTECYKPDTHREDKALHDTMQAIRDRLTISLEVAHPVTPNEMITKGPEDPKARTLREKLSDAIEWMKPLFKPECTRSEALAVWDKVFNTEYFGKQSGKEDDDDGGSRKVLTSGLVGSVAGSGRGPVRKEGGGRYA